MRRSRLAPAFLLALFMASCGNAERDATAPEPPPPDPSPMGDTMPEGVGEPTRESPNVPQELRFTAPALGGGTIHGADYAGRDLVIWFWAPW